MIEILYCGSSSACLEIKSGQPFTCGRTYRVLVDGEEQIKGENNVFSLYGLKPLVRYELRVVFDTGEEETLSLTTGSESCCINVKDFGARGDGDHEDTAAIQAAVNFLPEGGRLLFPEGTYLICPVALKSHMTLELCEGAVLLGSPERERYPVIPAAATDPVSGQDLPLAGFEGLEQDAYQSLLQASYAEDIAIVGRGTIDGNGQNGDWWRDFHSFPAARPRVIFLNRCKHVTLHGLTVANGPSWHIHPFFTEDFSLLDCFVTAPKISPNTDGIDPESCDGVRIIGCRFSVGDDCIAVKAGKLEMARKYQRPANHHVIRNCLMEFGHGAVTLGSELSAGIRNLSVTDCRFHATDRGLRIKTRRGRGEESLITNVLFDNIRMDKVLTPVVINMWYNCCDPDRYSEYVWSRKALPVDDRTPHLGSFAFRNMECVDAEVAACYIDGLPESPIDEVVLENIRVNFARDARPGVPAMENFAEERCRLGFYLDHVRRIRIRQVRVAGVKGEKLIADHYEDIETEDFEVE